MIDGIDIEWNISADQAGYIKIYFAPNAVVNTEQTGEIKTKIRGSDNLLDITTYHTGKFETFRIEVRENNKKNLLNGVSQIRYYLRVNGSFHKNHFGGKNLERFNYKDLKYQVMHLCAKLQVNAKESRILGVECGVNVQLQQPALPFLKSSLIEFKGHERIAYKKDNKGKSIGFYFDREQDQIKIYDKALQYNKGINLMRFEIKYTRMRPLKKIFGIAKNNSHLSLIQLLDIEKLYKLKKLLLRAWDNILLYDTSINLAKANIPAKEKQLLEEGRSYYYWQDLRTQVCRNVWFKRKRDFRTLLRKYGNNEHSKIQELISVEWEMLLNNKYN